jgi:hypothetical protein
MSSIIKSAPGRIALVGNPFDIYGGSTIALTLKDLRSYVFLQKNGHDHQEISSEIYKPGNNRIQQRNELEHAVIEELDLQFDYFKLFDVSDMPYETGFARSTAAVVAMLRAFNELFDLGIKDNEDIAELAWRIERKLGVCGGQERYAIAHDDLEIDSKILEHRIKDKKERNIKEVSNSRLGRLFYMNFAGRENHRFDNNNYAIVSELPVPDMKIGAAYATSTKSSFSYHQKLRELFKNNEDAKNIILKYKDKSVLNTNTALGEFRRKNPSLEIIGKCMSESLNHRFSMFNELADGNYGFSLDSICKDTLKMKEIAEKNGAYGINQPGSKSIIFLYDDIRALSALEKSGYHTISLIK